MSIGFERTGDLEAALPPELLREALPWDAAFLPGKAFLAYQRKSGKKSPLPDFFISDHAAVRNFTLLTRDPRRFPTYLPSLSIISP